MVVKSVNLAPDVLMWLEQNSEGNVSKFLNEFVREHFSRKKSAFGWLKGTKLGNKNVKDKKDRVDAW